MKTRTIFRGIRPFKPYTVLSWERVSEREEHATLLEDAGGCIEARVLDGMRGGAPAVGTRTLLAATRQPVGGRAEIINQPHPRPRIGRVTLGLLAHHAVNPAELLESHLEWARYGSVGSAEIEFVQRSGRMELYAEDGNLLLNAAIDEFSVKGDRITLASSFHSVPETVAIAAAGRSLDDIVDHPVLRGLGIVIESMTAGGDGTPVTITTRDDGIPVTLAIAMTKNRSY